jgi:hypothetical protein
MHDRATAVRLHPVNFERFISQVQNIKRVFEEFPLEHVLEVMNLVFELHLGSALCFIRKRGFCHTESEQAQGR